MADPQTLIREAQEKAEPLCRLAVPQTPADYQSFIPLIEQRKKVGGPRSAPIWATVRQPYLSADGRIKMARDQHREAGKRFDIQSEFLVEPTSGQLLARATLTSEIYGMAVAHARVFLGGEGVNESNPLEDGETSAVARGLGMMGFRCVGAGAASAGVGRRGVALPDSGWAVVGEARSGQAANGRCGWLRSRRPAGGRPEARRREACSGEGRERSVRRYQDAGVAAGFRDQCARLAETTAA